MLSSKNSFHHNFENWKFFISSFVLAMFSILILSKLFLLLTFFALLTLFYTGEEVQGTLLVGISCVTPQ